MEQLMQQLTGRPGEQAKTRRSKQALKQRMQPDLNCLLRWLGGGYAGFHLLPATLQQRAAAAANADDWTADVICRGVYPWEGDVSAAGTPSPAAATREQLITRLRAHTSELARTSEEVSLFEEERKHCLAFLQQRQAASQAACERTAQRSAALQVAGMAVP
ncbi:xylose [Micractinium conductrix]|uniref:Xylose n=1 Tax=Micractinium conductrix TaxID=554055 RepID=A0A2P6V060_9CHLO|nr:xylose [Micractinium conductrix]|eukprot:PSC67479.1 xylose [Micractinium conductrix]